MGFIECKIVERKGRREAGQVTWCYDKQTLIVC
jgi:hypothetical protein